MASDQPTDNVYHPKLVELETTHHNTDQIHSNIKFHGSESFFKKDRIIMRPKLRSESSVSEVLRKSPGIAYENSNKTIVQPNTLDFNESLGNTGHLLPFSHIRPDMLLYQTDKCNVQNKAQVKKTDDSAAHCLPDIFELKSFTPKKVQVVPKKRKNQIVAHIIVEPNIVKLNELQTDNTHEQPTNTIERPSDLSSQTQQQSTKKCGLFIDSDTNKKEASSKAGIVCNVVDLEDFSNEFDDSIEKFRCKNCNKLYKTKGSLLGHMRNICGKTAKHLCPFCPYKAKSSVSVRVHVGRNHKVWPHLTTDNRWVY